MAKFIAVDGATVIIDPPNVSGSIQVVGPPDPKVKAGGKNIYVDQMQVIVKDVASPPAIIPDPGPYTFNLNATATKVKASNKFVMLEGDTAPQQVALPEIPNAPPAPPAPGTPQSTPFTVKILVAGQVKVKAS